MWTPETFPDADNVPWKLLIRANFVREVDAFVATAILAQLAQVASVEVTAQVTEAANKALRQAPADKLGRGARAEAMVAVADFIEICPPWWPWPWPRPWPWPGPRPWQQELNHPLEQLGTPYEGLVLQGALDLIDRVGSPGLQEGLGTVLKEIGHR